MMIMIVVVVAFYIQSSIDVVVIIIITYRNVYFLRIYVYRESEIESERELK